MEKSFKAKNLLAVLGLVYLSFIIAIIVGFEGGLFWYGLIGALFLSPILIFTVLKTISEREGSNTIRKRIWVLAIMAGTIAFSVIAVVLTLSRAARGL